MRALEKICLIEIMLLFFILFIYYYYIITAMFDLPSGLITDEMIKEKEKEYEHG